MDTNDKKPQDEKQQMSSYDKEISSENLDNNSMSYPPPPPPQDGQYRYYMNMPPEGQQYENTAKHKGRGKRVAGFIILIVLCLAIGGLLTSYVIMPLVDGIKSNVALIEQSREQEPSPAEQQELMPPAEQEQQPGQTPKQPPATTDSPEIGGQVPNISGSDNVIVQIAKEVGPAIVGVTVSIEQTGANHQTISRESGYGTGIILSEDGYIVTNNHVIAKSDSVKITLINGETYPASIVGADATTDIAVLKIDKTGLTAAALGDSDSLQVGETVVAIGNPLGSDLAGSVTSGIVSALNREISTNGYSQKYIQTDAAINPGNSGGALVNSSGEVIGINTLKTYLAGYDDYGMPIGTEGIGFAIPISTAKPIIEQLMRTGQIERPGIGISCLADLTNAYNPEGSPEGVTVVEVTKGGPADNAGISPNDIILSVDGQQVTTVDELTSIIKSHSIGDKLDVTVWRDGQEYRSSIKVGNLNDM